MDPDHQSLDPELQSPDIPKRVEIRLRSRIQGRNRNTSNPPPAPDPGRGGARARGLVAAGSSCSMHF